MDLNPISVAWAAVPLPTKLLSAALALSLLAASLLGFGYHCYNKGYAESEKTHKADEATALEMRDQAASEKATFENSRNLAVSKKSQADRAKIADLQAKLASQLAARPKAPAPECDDPQETTDTLGAIIENAREAMK